MSSRDPNTFCLQRSTVGNILCASFRPTSVALFPLTRALRFPPGTGKRKAPSPYRQEDHFTMNDLFPHLHNDEAIRLLKVSIKLNKAKERLKAINRALREADRTDSDEPLEMLGSDRVSIASLKEPDPTGTRGIHPARLAAYGKSLGKIRDWLHDEYGLVIVDHQLKPASPCTTTQNTQELFGDVRIVDNVMKNRVQIFFPYRPDQPTRQTLKCWGYRWSAAVGAYQRVRSPEALHTARRICSKYR